MSNDSLGDRMKTYEAVPKLYLTRRTPVIGRWAIDFDIPVFTQDRNYVESRIVFEDTAE